MRPGFRPLYLLLPASLAMAGFFWHRAETTPISSASSTEVKSAADGSTPAPSMPGDAATDVGNPRDADRQMQRLLTLAEKLPPDFRADILLRVATRAPDVSTDLSLKAYELAKQAPRKLPGMAGLPYFSDFNHDELYAARTAGLDQLSLQARAIRAVMTDRHDQVPALMAGLPSPAAASCDDTYIDDPSLLYELAGETLPKDESTRADAVSQRLQTGQREVDIGPALKLVLSLPAMGPADDGRVASALTALFARARGNDVGFTATSLSVAADVPLVLERIDTLSAQRDTLRAAYRDYVGQHLAQERCASSVRGSHWLLEQSVVAEAHDVTPPPEDTTVFVPTPIDEAVSAVRRDGFALRTQLLGETDKASRDDPAIDAAATTFLDQMSIGPLVQAAQADATGRVRRTQMFEVLRYLEYAPAGVNRDRAFALFSQLFSGRYYQLDHDLWFGDLRRIAGQIQRWPDRNQRLAQLAESSDGVIATYALLMQDGSFL